MSQESKPVLYVNIVILDVSEVIRAKVKKKVEASNIPKQMKGVVAKSATSVASSRVKRSNIAKRVSEQMCQAMPVKMKDKGLTVILEEVFREEHYFVLELQVQHVDALAVEKRQHQKHAEMSDQDDIDTSSTMAGTLLDWTLKLIGRSNQSKLEDEFLPAKVQEKLEHQMMKVMEEKFDNMHLKAEVQVLKEKKQARYFFSKLKSIREETSKVTYHMRDFRKKLSSEQGDEEDSIESRDNGAVA